MFGPSAGWHLPASFLGRFEKLDCIDPDPLARWIFLRRFRGMNIDWHFDDYLGGDQAAARGPLDIDRLGQLFADFPHTAFLFPNVISQISGLFAETVYAVDEPPRASAHFVAWKSALAGHLAGRSWACFHDRLSASAPPLIADGDLVHEVNSAELAQLAWGHLDVAIDAYDALTDGIAADLPRRLMVWQREPGMFHVVEAMSVVASTKGRV